MKRIGWTCALLLLAGSAHAQTTDIPGFLKQERWAGNTLTRFHVATNAPILATAPYTKSYPTNWVHNDGSPNYVAKLSGLITPPSSGLYDFYVAADDDADVFLSTTESPAGKVNIARENVWSNLRNWTSAGSGGAAAVNQKSSATFTNAAGVAPFAAGIQLNAGTWYYLEVVWDQGGGGGHAGVTMVPHGVIPTDGEESTLNGSLIKLKIQTPTTLSVAGPTNVTSFNGVRARFAVTATTDSQDGVVYQWRRNGVNITNATASSYTLIASTSDNGATFDCVVGVPALGTPSLTSTSSVATLTVQGSGAVTVNNALKRDLFAGMAAPRRTGIENGNEPVPTSTTGIPALDLPTAGQNYGERIYGFFTPTATANYVFFVAGDDDTDVFLSTDNQPANKRLIAQEAGWSGARNWKTIGGGSTTEQKSSATWSPDQGVTFPYSAGIPLTNGVPYYIEVVHNGAAPGNSVGVTYATVEEVALGLPADGDATRLTNNVISFVTKPTTTFAITQQPANVSTFEGLPWQIEVTVNTDSEVAPTYQWFKNNVAIPGATTRRVSSGSAILGDAGTYRVEVSVPGQTTLVSGNATLTVQQGIFAAGQLKLERWLNDVTTRAIVSAGVPGSYPDPDFSTYITRAEVPDLAGVDNFVQRISGAFVPPTTGLYTFYVASDDDTDVFLGTSELASTKRLIAQEAGWSNWRNYNTPGGGGSTLEQKRSDLWSPDGGNTFPYSGGIQLTAGQRYYFEVVHHDGTWGGHVSVAYTMTGDPAPTDGSGNNVPTGNGIGVLVPAATTLTITNQPQSVATTVSQPVYLGVGATSDGVLPLTYQWRRDGTNIAGATFPNYGFIADPSDSGHGFDVVVASPGVSSLTKTSAVATVTVGAGGTFTAGSLTLERWVGGAPSMAALKVGGLGIPTLVTNITSVDTPDLGIDNYAQRMTGFFIPPVTTNYVFFVDSDDETDLYIGTNDLPSSKLLRAQEPNWSTGRYNWLSAAGGGLSSQKRSDQWSPDGGVTMPWSAGIPLVAGERYYMEIHFHEGSGGDWTAAYYMFVGEPDPANDGTTLPNVSGPVLGRLVPPVTTQPVLTITRSGNNVNVSWSPAGGTLQSTTALPGGWSDVGTANPAVIPIGPGNLFLRVEQ